VTYINAGLIADLTWRVLRGAGNSEVGRTNQLTAVVDQIGSMDKNIIMREIE